MVSAKTEQETYRTTSPEAKHHESDFTNNSRMAKRSPGKDGGTCKTGVDTTATCMAGTPPYASHASHTADRTDSYKRTVENSVRRESGDVDDAVEKDLPWLKYMLLSALCHDW